MKPTSHTIILILAMLTSMASAYAASPREELTQMVEQLQKTPTDNALREKIIKLAQNLKPALAVPEEAQRREGRAKFAFKSAKSNDDYLSAAREYEEAVRVAPWIPGYYSDLCTIYEKAEKYAEAKRHCEFSLIGLTDPSQVNEIKQRIAGLEFGIEKLDKANSPEARAAKEKQADQHFIASLEGAKYICPERSISFYTDGRPDKTEREEIEIKSGSLSGALVTTWISDRGLRGATGTLYVGFRASWWAGNNIPIQGRVFAFNSSYDGNVRVEIFEDYLVLTASRFVTTCRR